jgi:hypothetical protein
MERKCPSCGKDNAAYPQTEACAWCHAALPKVKPARDRPDNARITITIPRRVYDELAKQAEAKGMILSEFVTSELRTKLRPGK